MVLAFHEKPTPGLAAAIIGRGALWNSFVMVARARRVLELLRALRPDDVALLEDVSIGTSTLDTVYDRLQSWNFSRGFLSRVSKHLVVARADDLGWNDWGTPEAIERSFAAMGLVPPWHAPVGAVSLREDGHFSTDAA